MKKVFLTSACLGLIIPPVTTLISCFDGFEPDKNERDDLTVITPRSSYRTALDQVSTTDFETGQFYSAKQIGIDKVFGENYRFEVQSYDDLLGQIEVDVYHRKTDSSWSEEILKRGVKISGFLKVSASDFLTEIVDNLPNDHYLQSSLSNIKASFFKNLNAVTVADLGIEEHFNFRQSKHSVKIDKVDDQTGELDVSMRVTLGGKHKDLRIRIGGFLVGDQQLREILQHVQSVLDQISPRPKTSHSDKLATSFLKNIDSSDFYQRLGIGKFPDLKELRNYGVKVLFSKGKQTSDSAGQLELTITIFFEIDSKRLQRNKTILISGFRKSSLTKEDKQRIDAQEIRDYFEKTFDHKTKLTDTFASHAKLAFEAAGRDLKALGLNDLPRWIKNLTRRIKLNVLDDVDDQQGTLKLLVEIHVGKISQKTTILIKGFKTSAQWKKDQEQKDKAFLENLLEWLTNHRTKSKLDNKSPSEFEGKRDLTFEKLGLGQIPETTSLGTRFGLRAVDFNDDEGILIVEVTLSRQGQTKIGSISISGFLANKKHLPTLWNWIKRNRDFSSLNDKLPSQIGAVGKTVNWEELGVDQIPPNKQRGTKIELKISKIFDKSGSIELEIVLRHGKGKKDYRGKLIIKGFLAEDKFLKNLLDWIQENHVRSKSFDRLPSQIGSVGQNTSFDKLGLPDLTVEQKQAAQISLKLVELDDEKGRIKVEIQAALLGEPISKLIWVTGFKTNLIVLEEVKQRIEQDMIFTTSKQKLPSSLAKIGQQVDWDDLGVSAEIVAKLKSENVKIDLMVSELNNQLGTIELWVDLVRGKSKLPRFKLTIRGYKSSRAIVDKLNQLLVWFEKNAFRIKISSSLASELFQVGGHVTLEQLGIVRPPDQLVKNVNLSFQISEINDLTGTVKVKILAKENGEKVEKTLTVGGFLKVDDHLENLLDYLGKERTKTGLSQQLPSQVGQQRDSVNLSELGLDDLPLRWKNVNVKITILDVVDQRGEIEILVEVSVGQSRDWRRFVVQGFKTSTQVKQELLERETDSFQSFKNWMLENWSRTSFVNQRATQLAKIGQIIESDFGHKLGLPNLEKHLPEWFTKITLEVVNVNDYHGTIDFKVLLWGKISQKSREFSFSVSGFKTIAVKNAKELDSLLDWIADKRSLTSSNDKLPSESGFFPGNSVSFEDLGLVGLPNETDVWEGVRVTLTIKSFNNKEGQLTILAQLESDHAKREREITIRGYLTLERLFESVFQQLTKLLSLSLEKLSNLLPSQMGTVNQLLKFSDFGLPEPSYESRRRVNYKIIIKGVDDERGLLTIVLELERDGISSAEEFVLSDFLTLKQYQEKIVLEKISLIRQLNKAQDNQSDIEIKIAKDSIFYDADIAKITIEDVANNLREFSIQLPSDLAGFKLVWSSVKPLVSHNALLVDLQISWGQISKKVTFAIIGFLTPAGKMVRDVVKTLPSRVTTKMTRKLVGDFERSRIYTYRELGIDPFNVLGIFNVDLVVDEVDDRAGIVQLLVLVSSSGEMQSKKVEVEGFWNDSQRRAAQQKILGQMASIFGEFYFDDQISGLSERETQELLTYDFSTNNFFIGADPRYQVGQQVAWQKILTNKSKLLQQWLTKTDQYYTLNFEIVERPEQVFFNGSIRVRPWISFIDQKVYLPHTIVIGGFKTFENHFQAVVKDWVEKKISHQLRTSSKGLIISLLQALDKTEPGLSRVSEFKKLTGLSDVLEGPKIGRHQVVIRNIFWNRYLDPKRYHLSELNFRFLTGLTGPDSDYFNVSKLQTQNLQPSEVIEEKRSFTTPVRGFKTKDDVISVVRKELQKYDSLKWAYPDQNARPHNQSLDYSGMRGPKDFGHFRGVLSEMYGREQMPEFHPSYYRLGKKRELFDKFVKESKSGYVSRFDYQSAADVADWLKIVGKFDQFAPWNKVPIDYNHLWNNSDPATRHLFGNARLYFKFTRYNVGFYNSMFFLVGVEMVPNSPSEAIKPVSPHKIPAPKQNQSQANIYLVDAKEEFQVKLPNHLSDYMAASLERDFLKFRLFTGQVRDKLGARMLECSGECERIEVVAHRSPQDKDWDTKLPPLPGLERNFDPSTTRYFNEQVLKLTNVSYRVGKKDYILRDANTLNNLLIGDRYDGEGNKLLIPEEWIEYVSHLAGLGVSLFFKKVSWEQYPRSAKKDGYAAVARFRPVLIYNAKVQLENQKEPSVESVRQQPIVHIGQKVWEIYYRLI